MMNKRQKAYSLIELMVIITVIGILAAISTVSYSNWRKSTTATQLKNDLNMAAAAMEDARNYDNSYPRYINNIYTPSQGISIDGGSTNSDKSEYILNTIGGGQSYSINQEGTIKQENPPVIYLDANKPLSFLDTGSFWNDISGNDNNLKFVSSANSEGAYTAGDKDKTWSIKFDNNNRASTNFSPLVDGITWEVWLKYPIVGELARPSTFLSLGNTKFFIMKNNSTSTSMALYGWTKIGSSTKTVAYTGNLSKNSWLHLVFSVNYDSDKNLSTLSLYKNGIKISSKEYSGKPVYDNNFIVGGTADTYFNGSISLIKVFDGALTDDEIKQEYDLLKYRYHNI